MRADEGGERRDARHAASLVPALEVCDLTCGYRTDDGERRVVEGFSLELHAGEVHCLLGPNGVGKTTLFKTILGLMPAFGGRVVVEGHDASGLSSRELAQLVAYVPQAHTPPFAFTARDVVVMGRIAHLGLFSSPRAHDYQVANRAIERLGISQIAGRAYTELSGGERQMVLIARAVAQQPRVLMMDEPTASLDLGNQARVLRAVRTLAADGLAVLMTTHTPDHLSMCGDTGTLMMRDGSRMQGNAVELLDGAALGRAYGCEVMVVDASWHGRTLRLCRPVIDGPAPPLADPPSSDAATDDHAPRQAGAPREDGAEDTRAGTDGSPTRAGVNP